MIDHRIFIRYVSIVALIYFSVFNKVDADTLILLSEESSKSNSISKIAQEIQFYESQADILYTNSLELDLPALEREYESLIVLGDDLAVQSFPTPPNIPYVVGAFAGNVDLDPSSNSLSLELRPRVLYEEIIKAGLPLKVVWTVITPNHNPELLQSAMLDAAEMGIELKTIVSNGKQTTARAWFDVLASIDNKTEAIWISDSSYLEESGAYKYLLETAWKRSVMIVSHFPRYARRAVAIGFLPDLKLYARRLVDLLSEVELETGARSYITTDVAQRVLNKRTLEHLGLRLPRDLDTLAKDDIVIR